MSVKNSSNAKDFLLGVNYWPRTSAMAMWSCFDRDEIDDDLKHIATLGLHVVRFFLLWEAFQPQPDKMNTTALDNFEWFLARVAFHHLRAMPTFFTGHMSGVNWLPAWTLDRAYPAERFRTISNGTDEPYGIGDFYTGELLDAQKFHVNAVASRVRNHPAILSWDLGNEFSNLREPKSPDDAAHWSKVLTQELTTVSGHAVTGGTHGEDITRDRQLRLSSLSAPWAYATMHGYSVYSDFARDRLDVDVVPFLAEITRSCAQKSVLFSEFGNPTCSSTSSQSSEFACLTEDEMPAYARGVLERLHAGGALGAFWWCWADYASELKNTAPFDKAPHELTFGIVRSNGREKPIAAELARFANEKRQVLAATAPLVTEAAYFASLPSGVAPAYAEYIKRVNA
jgi:endo-1,4-beta-mannosidase